MDVVLPEMSFKGKASFQQVKKKEVIFYQKKILREKAKKWEGRRYLCEMLTGLLALTIGNGKGSFWNVLIVKNPNSQACLLHLRSFAPGLLSYSSPYY